MKTTITHYAQSVRELSHIATPDKQKLIAKGFLVLLIKRGETKKLPAILVKIAKLDEKEKNEKQVEVRSASKLSSQQMTQCEALAREIFDAKTVVMTETIDETLLGGVRLVTDDASWDMTVQRRLRDLSRVLMQ